MLDSLKQSIIHEFCGEQPEIADKLYTAEVCHGGLFCNETLTCKPMSPVVWSEDNGSRWAGPSWAGPSDETICVSDKFLAYWGCADIDDGACVDDGVGVLPLEEQN